MINRVEGRVRFHSLAWGVWSLFLITGLAIVDDYGVSMDTGIQRDITINTLNYVLHDDPGRWHKAADHLYGVAFEAPLLLLTERVLGLEDPRHVHLARHVLTHLFFLIGGFCCYLLARRLSGDRLVALLVMLLFLLSPRLYAHSFFNSKDAVFASAFVMALLFASRAFDKDSVGAYRWCGAAAGLLVNLRIMGVVLFAVVLAFRLWAWFRAEEPAARRRAAATAGVFALWGIIVFFISLPYLWGDPIGRLAEMSAALSDHPHLAGNLFQGEMFSSAALPWDYVLRWFAISQPPVTLLLGLLGMGALGLAARGAFRRGAGAGPGAAWGAAELRFGVLLATCFALPLVAFALLRPNAYHGWRHFYFLHGPFCLLATFALMGLRQLSARGLQRRWLGGVACALAAAGLCVVVVQMARLHPYQYLYFNFFVDRKTPERLRARYTMDYHLMAVRQNYEYLLKRTSAAAINLEKKHLYPDLNLGAMILPAADRRRFTHDPSRDPDFYLVNPGAWWKLLPGDPFPFVLHRIKVYNNTIATVSTPDLSRVDPVVADEYRTLHRATMAGEPVARGGGFDVHLHGGQLAWVKEACEPGALRREFLLKLYPVEARFSRHPLRDRDYVEFEAYGVRLDGKCLGAARLPDFALTRARLGQPGKWEVEVPL